MTSGRKRESQLREIHHVLVSCPQNSLYNTLTMMVLFIQIGLGFFLVLCYFLLATAHQPRFTLYRSGKKLDTVTVDLAEFARSTCCPSGGSLGVDQYCRIMCTAIVLSTHSGTAFCGSCRSGCGCRKRRIVVEFGLGTSGPILFLWSGRGHERRFCY